MLVYRYSFNHHLGCFIFCAVGGFIVLWLLSIWAVFGRSTTQHGMGSHIPVIGLSMGQIDRGVMADFQGLLGDKSSTMLNGRRIRRPCTCDLKRVR